MQHSQRVTKLVLMISALLLEKTAPGKGSCSACMVVVALGMLLPCTASQVCSDEGQVHLTGDGQAGAGAPSCLPQGHVAFQGSL